MSGVVFLKLIYLYKQKKSNKIEFNEHQTIFDICLNEVQIFKNRFYATFIPYVSLNRNDRNIKFSKKLQQCLVVEKHNKDKLDMSDIISRFNSYGSMEYEINRNLNKIYLLFQSEHCQRRILKDYFNHPLYKIEEFKWLKHSVFVKYSVGISIVLTGICSFFLVKRRM
jgi:predicted methyltransferase